MSKTLTRNHGKVTWRIGDPAPLPSDGTPVWSRLPQEGPAAWRYFQAYRDMDPEGRSQQKVSKACDVALRTIEYCSRKYRWVERVRAFERDRDLRTLEAVASRTIRITDEQLSILEERIAATDPMELDPQDVARWLDVAVRIGNASRGLPNDRPATTLNGNVTTQHTGTDAARERLMRRVAEIADREEMATAEDLQRRTVVHEGA